MRVSDRVPFRPEAASKAESRAADFLAEAGNGHAGSRKEPHQTVRVYFALSHLTNVWVCRRMKDGCVEADMDKDGTISVGKETDVLMGFLNQNGINYGGSFDKVPFACSLGSVGLL